MTVDAPESMDIPLSYLELVCITVPSEGAHWTTVFAFQEGSTVEVSETKMGGISFNMTQPGEHSLKEDDIVLQSGVDLGTPPQQNRQGSTPRNYIGRLDVSLRPLSRLITARPLVRITIPVKETSTTGGAILQVILKEGMHQYRFHNEGCGCLYWQLELIKVLGKSGCLKPTAHIDAESQIASALKGAVGAVKHAVTWPPRAGAFYEFAQRKK